MSKKLAYFESIADGTTPLPAESKSPVADLVIYWDESGPECQGPILFLRATGIKVTEKKFVINRETKQHPNRTDVENTKHNYNHSLPTLFDRHSDFAVFESFSILRYLAEKFVPDSHWYPSDLRTRTRINNYLDWHAFTVRYSFMTIGLAYLPGFTSTGVDKEKSLTALAKEIIFGSPHHLWKDRADNGLLNQLKIINDKWLQGTKYLASDEISIADLVLYADSAYVLHLFHLDFKQFPNLNRWYGLLDNQFGKDESRQTYVKYMTDLGGLFKGIFPSSPSYSSSSFSSSPPSAS